MTTLSARVSQSAGNKDDELEDIFEGGYYVYGLIDPFALNETDDPLLSIFYVGKGKDLRWEQHEKEVRRSLEAESLLLERRGSKAERIRKILERGGKVSAIRLSGGYPNEQNAYRAESLAIDLVDAQLSAAGRPPLTNATPGHHAGFVALGEHFKFVSTRQADLDVESANPTTALLVKGTTKPIAAGNRLLLDTAILPEHLQTWRSRITPLSVEDSAVAEPTRPGWDPDNPWNDSQARERACRYWQLGVSRVEKWLSNPESMPTALLLGIPHRSETVIRFAWEIDPQGKWEFYPQGNQWGVPLGRRLHEHLRLGETLYENRDGDRVQVLRNYSAGWRVIQI